MPAHTTEADVGRAYLSNGDLLTARGRRGNELADTLAKRGTDQHRLPEDIRERCRAYDALAIWAAREVAIQTHAANNAKLPGVPGRSRDSTGLPARKRPGASRGETWSQKASQRRANAGHKASQRASQQS